MSLIKYSFSNKATKAAAATATIAAAASSSSAVASFFLGTSTSTTSRTLQTADNGVGINSNDENDRILEKNVKCNNTAVRLSMPPITGKASASISTATDITTRNFSTTPSNKTNNSDTTTTTTTTTWQPNQTTSTFTKMKSTCPDLMKAYAQCVIQKQNEGVLEQGACQVEYEQLMECFRMVRSSSSS
ncbi:hypothetical protein QTG54_006138 [Skeletonema marinoi]|uniref:Uncharacterized protein n=1 Tax=Skeletonema marinoi TaxID=267567 RepID=A0AAD9DDP5_9STRA|nr:hypothetical protein QTG54_006138 [Skeletonema marinoi]